MRAPREHWLNCVPTAANLRAFYILPLRSKDGLWGEAFTVDMIWDKNPQRHYFIEVLKFDGLLSYVFYFF